MRVFIEDNKTVQGHTGMSCVVENVSALTATEVVHMWCQAMLGFGFQKGSVFDALCAVAEEYEPPNE